MRQMVNKMLYELQYNVYRQEGTVYSISSKTEERLLVNFI